MLIYHATYRPYAQSIKKCGLSLSKVGSTYEISKDVKPCIYFTDDIELSYSFADVALDDFDDDKYEKFENTIIILVVNTDYLDKRYLYNGDSNIRDDSVRHYWTYFNNIPPNLIGIMNFKTNKIEYITSVNRFTDKYICNF